VIGLFLWLSRRIMVIGRQAIALDKVFSGLVAQGVGICRQTRAITVEQ
jgi:cell division protein FtsW